MRVVFRGLYVQSRCFPRTVREIALFSEDCTSCALNSEECTCNRVVFRELYVQSRCFPRTVRHARFFLQDCTQGRRLYIKLFRSHGQPKKEGGGGGGEENREGCKKNVLGTT